MMAQLSWQEKWTLRFAVVGLLFLALSGFEGLLMRTQQYDIDALKPMEGVLNPIRLGSEPSQEELYYEADGIAGWPAAVLSEIRRLGERLSFHLREWETLASQAA